MYPGKNIVCKNLHNYHINIATNVIIQCYGIYQRTIVIPSTG